MSDHKYPTMPKKDLSLSWTVQAMSGHLAEIRRLMGIEEPAPSQAPVIDPTIPWWQREFEERQREYAEEMAQADADPEGVEEFIKAVRRLV